MTGWFVDIAASWVLLVVASITAVIFGYLYLYVIKLLGGCIIWISIILIQLTLLGGAGYTWYYRDLKYRPDNKMYDYMTWTMYGILILWFVVALLVCCFRHAIKIGIAVF